LEHKISLHKAASAEVRYIVIFNNGSPTKPNGASELRLAPHRDIVLMHTTKHPPAEIAMKEVKGGGRMFPRELLDCRLQSLSRTTNYAA
jgi:hypothetical protein